MYWFYGFNYHIIPVFTTIGDLVCGTLKHMCYHSHYLATLSVHAIICCFANDILFILFQVDASVGTEMGTMTEPDCLGPLDPGTAVTLEGIVWQETDGGKACSIYQL